MPPFSRRRYLEDGFHVRIERAEHPRDGLELVFEVEPEDSGDGPGTRPGYANAFDQDFGNAVVEFLEKVVGGLYGAARDAAVLGKDEW